MAGEEWARRILEKELKRNVALNDDGSMPSMYDLRIGPADVLEMAVECVGAVDASLTETWNIGPAKGPLELVPTSVQERNSQMSSSTLSDSWQVSYTQGRIGT